MMPLLYFVLTIFFFFHSFQGTEAFITPDFTGLQEYLEEGKGMNIRKAWEKGVSGQGITIHLYDSEIYENHEGWGENFKVIGNDPKDPDPEILNHGTASAGLIVGKNDKLGITGIAYSAKLNFYAYPYQKELIDQVKKEDIIILNIQTNREFPAISEKQYYELIKNLIDKQAIVISAAGNGGNDLSDPISYFQYYGDSGIILIGASNPTSGRRLPFSNYNSPYQRILNSWGYDVVTTGYGDLQEFQGNARNYTNSYSGTSSATPLVGGALALIQSYYKEKTGGEVLNTQEIYDLVSKTGYQEGVQDGIGIRPNVYEALLEIDKILDPSRVND